MMDEIVISGMSGRFPECDTVEEFKTCLLEGVDLVTVDDRRWQPGMLGTIHRMGKMKHLDRFDAQHFSSNAAQAHRLSPEIRKLLEATHEAIVDAGVNPTSLRGTRVGVFVGYFGNELSFQLDKLDEHDGHVLLGGAASTKANRISYAFDLKGPSFVVDSACSSSLVAIDLAVKTLRSGDCCAAIVGGCNILLDPRITQKFQKLGVLTHDVMRPYDEKAQGFIRSEGVGVVFLQKASDARRIYATVLASNTNSDGYKHLGPTYPSRDMQSQLIQEVYNTAGIVPSDVEYVEAHGTATQVGDPQEVNAFADVLCVNRKEPLLIGSIKSNIGHTEGASGIVGLIKTLIAIETGFIPPNLHYEKPNPRISSLVDGSIKVVNHKVPHKGGLMAVHSLGVGGSNVHVVLRPNKISKMVYPPEKYHRLVTASGRTKFAVQTILNNANLHHKDTEFLALIDKLHETNIQGHYYRGYKILGIEDSNVSERYMKKRPVWFVYSGMGSQWNAMGKDLMNLDVFKTSITKSSQILKPYNLDLMKLLTEEVEDFNEPTKAFVAITAIQIALTDVLFDLNIQPDGLIGHSMGEIGCAYADGAFSAEQAILASYFRGKSIVESGTPDGALALVNLSSEETQKLCPPSVSIACFNSSNSVTVSGPSKDISEFVDKLTSDGIQPCLVNTPKYAFHTHHISEAGLTYENYLNGIVFEPKRRSSRWISSSVPASETDTTWSQFSSPKYHANNFVSPVLFHQAVQRVPDNAVVVEVSPHGILQFSIRKTVDKEACLVDLSEKRNSDNLLYFLTSLGKLYAFGVQVNVRRLYQPVTFPVGRTTPMINSMVLWDHSVQWNVPRYVHKMECFKDQQNIIRLSKQEHKYLSGHCIHGRTTFPSMGLLVFAWKVLATAKSKDYEQTAVIFENVTFYQQKILVLKESDMVFKVNVLEGTGNFEISESGSLVVTGQISLLEDKQPYTVDMLKVLTKSVLVKDDIYKELRLRGYDYDGLFQGIVESNISCTDGKIKWNNNWTCFLDTILQFVVLSEDTRETLMPTKLARVVVNPELHLKMLDVNSELLVHHDLNLNVVRTGGIEMTNIVTLPVSDRRSILPVSESYQFIPYEFVSWNENEKLPALDVLVQIIIENISTSKPKFWEDGSHGNFNSLLLPYIKTILSQNIRVLPDYTVMVNEQTETSNQLEKIDIDVEFSVLSNQDVIIVADGLTENNTRNVRLALESLNCDGFLLLEETTVCLPKLSNFFMEKITTQTIGPKTYTLFRKIINLDNNNNNTTVITVTQDNFSWLEPLKVFLKRDNKTTVYLVAQNEPSNGLLGMVKCLVREPGIGNLQAFLIRNHPETFSPKLEFYQKQIKKKLVYNVLKNGVWGSYRHLKLASLENYTICEDAYVDVKSFQWFESRKYDNNYCDIFCACINYQHGMLDTNDVCVEFSGCDQMNNRVMGISNETSLTTKCLVKDGLVWSIPNQWSMEDAATVPFAYSMSYYALIIRANLQSKETVLIHSGVTAVALAAITIALDLKCTIFTVVKNDIERTFLKETFPELLDTHIGNSKSYGFLKTITQLTHGVDVLFASCTDNLLWSSKWIGQNCRILSLQRNNSLISHEKNISFHLVSPETINDEDLKKIVGLVNDGIKNDVVKPLPRMTFEAKDVKQAFECFKSTNCIKTVLVKLREQETHKTCLPEVLKRTNFNPNKSYVVVGGLGGFGLELIDWLTNRGACKVVVSSRKGLITGYQLLCAEKWRRRGVTIDICTSNITTRQGVNELLNRACKLGQIGGIFNLAAIFKDGLFENQTPDDFLTACAPKADCTKYLDEISRKVAPQLDFFVTFSSMACGRGNPGVTNYGMANSAMEQICETRSSEGLPGLAVQWGLIGDVGFYWDNLASLDGKFLGLKPQPISSCLLVLDSLLNQHHSTVTSFVTLDSVKQTKQLETTPIDTVLSLLGIEDVQTVSSKMTLKELGMDSLLAAGIAGVLDKDYGFFLNPRQIQSMTIETLTELVTKNVSCSKTYQTDAQEQQIMNKLFNLTLITELQEEIIVDLKPNLQDLQKVGLPIFFIHPIEGNVVSLKNLASNTKNPTFGLQYIKTCTIKSIKKFAHHYLNQIEKIQQDGVYLLVGYSFGACVAFEMGIQLESKNKTVKLFLIDASHISVSKYLNRNLHNFFLTDYVRFLDVSDQEKFTNNLPAQKTLLDKLNYVESFIKNSSRYSSSDFGNVSLSFFYKSYAVMTYEPNVKFEGSMVFIKASEQIMKQIPSDFDLNSACNGKVTVEVVEGDHHSILKGKAVERVAEILQKFRD